MDFRNDGQSNHLKDVFKKTSIAGRLEASANEIVDVVFPFLEAIVEALCDSNETADGRRVFNKLRRYT